MTRNRWHLAAASIALLLSACSADASATRGSRDEDPCTLLTADEAAQATGLVVTTAERRDDPNGDHGCNYIDSSGAWVGAVKITDPDRAAQRVTQRGSRSLEGIGAGGAVAEDGYVGYARVGSVAYLWASGARGALTAEQVTELLRATVR